jgi:CDP-diacylglycerol--glycerol-3-phosphate 3-phosphatidyltransferase
VTSEVGLWNVANVLTLARIVLVPVFVACLLAGGTAWRLIALATFCVASLTDLLDGRLARSRGLVTDFGKIADPVADKALTGAALICLSALGKLKTLLQVVAICLYVLPATLSPPGIVRGLFMTAAVAVTVVTGVDYVLQAVRLHRSEPAPDR